MFQVNPLLAGQRIHMKNQALFSLKAKSKKLKVHLLKFLFGALRVNFGWVNHSGFLITSDFVDKVFFKTFCVTFLIIVVCQVYTGHILPTLGPSVRSVC